MTINLLTTQEQYEALHQATLGKAKTIRVDSQALINILVDHAVLTRTARDKGIRVIEPTTGRRQKANLQG